MTMRNTVDMKPMERALWSLPTERDLEELRQEEQKALQEQWKSPHQRGMRGEETSLDAGRHQGNLETTGSGSNRIGQRRYIGPYSQ